jgi:hypothetical protein
VLVKGVDPGGRVLVRDNLVVDAGGAPLPIAGDGVTVAEAAPSWSRSPVEEAECALRRAGSRPARRDPIDARIVRSVIAGDGRIIDSQNQVGGYPVRPSTKRRLAVPDALEERRHWLDALSAELEEDRELDVAPLWKRLGGAFNVD